MSKYARPEGSTNSIRTTMGIAATIALSTYAAVPEEVKYDTSPIGFIEFSEKNDIYVTVNSTKAGDTDIALETNRRLFNYESQPKLTSKLGTFFNDVETNVSSGLFSFSDRVSYLLKKTSLNKSQLAAVLNVERKSLYDWQKNPEVQVRAQTKARVALLEELIAEMDDDHTQFLGKMAFGSHGKDNLAKSLTSQELSLDQLKELYDQYWDEFEGHAVRARIERNTKHFLESDGFGELV